MRSLFFQKGAIKSKDWITAVTLDQMALDIEKLSSEISWSIRYIGGLLDVKAPPVCLLTKN